ncbi:hypothetical protein LTR85_002041 [Meristemomyces frigidus]|nr:hypothetical protein LTR85_002041 [Meristemomyces frigidus]
MYKDEALELKFTDGESADAECTDDIGWNERGVKEYIRQVRRFKEELIVLVHMSAGAPARTTELTSITTTNPMGGRGRRGIYVERGLVAFVPEYGKMSSHSGKVKVIHRCVPKEVSELVVYYLWIVEPFVRVLQAGSRRQKEFSRFIWETKPERKRGDGWGDEEAGKNSIDGEEEDGRSEEEEEVGNDRAGEWAEMDGIEPMEAPPEPLNVDGFWDTDRVRVRRAVQSEWMSRFGIDIDAQLKRIVGVAAEFRGLQRPALTAIIERQMRVLIVMRTGGGKSLLFMLPAAGSQDGVTVVVVPLNALRADLKQRCDRVGIACAAWEGGKRPPDRARIVFVTPEAAVTEAFGRFMNEKVASGQLERVVIDECHIIIEEEEEAFRPDISRLYEMTEKKTQVVFLTATLPLSEEAQFCRAMSLSRSDVVTFRDVTTRPNFAYSVMEYEREEVEEAVQQVVAEKKEQYPSGVFHAHVGNEEEKGRILRRFTAGAEQVIVATNAFGLGIDAPSIQMVVHVGVRTSMKQYAQESGGAGRDEEVSEAVIMRANWTDRSGRRIQENEYGLAPPMKEFMRGEGCRRVPLDRVMDGRVDRVLCEAGEQPCDVCRGRPREGRRSRNRIDTEPSEERAAKRRKGGSLGRVQESRAEDVQVGWSSPERSHSGAVERQRRELQRQQRAEEQRAEQEREQEMQAEYERNSQQRIAIELGEMARRVGGGGRSVDELIDRFNAYHGKERLHRQLG